MGDSMDRAQAVNEAHQSDALLAHYRRGIRNSMYASELICTDCTAEIPEARRKAVPGCTRCVACQERHEILSNWRVL
jgi:phage/conjugal plasmid C-4 type zinc finger TraR family protein